AARAGVMRKGLDRQPLVTHPPVNGSRPLSKGALGSSVDRAPATQREGGGANPSPGTTDGTHSEGVRTRPCKSRCSGYRVHRAGVPPRKVDLWLTPDNKQVKQ